MVNKRAAFDRLPAGVQRVLEVLAPGDHVAWGSLRRLEPYSRDYGIERGRAIDRYYVDGFLAAYADRFHGRGLEVDNPGYLNDFGGSRLTSIEVVDINPDNPLATIVADLTEDGCLPVEAFDILVLTQTVLLVDRPDKMVRNCVKALAPGGTMLVTTTCSGPLVRPVDGIERWRAVPMSFEQLFAESAAGCELEHHLYGNLLSGVAWMYGMAISELTPAELEPKDPRYPLIAAVAVRKPA